MGCPCTGIAGVFRNARPKNISEVHMTRIALAICAHPKRKDRAEELSEKLGNAPICLDGDPISYGPGKNHWRAWMLANMNEDATHIAVLEDDAVVVDDFYTQAEAVLAVSPAPITSFYLGQGRPPQHMMRVQAAVGMDTDFIVSDLMLHGVAICMEKRLVNDMLSYVETCRKPYDEAIGRYARRSGNLIAYCNPSIVDHLDLPTLIDHPDRQPRVEERKAWRWGSRNHWGRSMVRL
jgi:hypothetical protein